MKNWSLQARLVIGLMLSLIVLMTLLWLLTRNAMLHVAEDNLVARLQRDSESLLRALNLDTQNKMQLDISMVDNGFQQPLSGRYFRLSFRDKVIRSRSLWDQDLDIPLLKMGEEQRLYREGPQQQRLLLWGKAYRKNGYDINIAVAEDLNSISQDIERFQWQFLWLCLSLLALLIVSQILIIRRGLRPLEKIRNELVQLRNGQLDKIIMQTPREISPLVDELNSLSQAFLQRLQRSRTALGNLAHALKTPLTVIGQVIEHKNIKSSIEDYELLKKQSNALRGLIDREMKRARLAGIAIYARNIDLRHELEDLLKTLSLIYKEKHIEIGWKSSKTVECPYDREDMMELFGNLLDNAYKWANSKIHISIEWGAELVVILEDDGPGCDQQEMQDLITRGKRLDEYKEGYGLGLSIVSDVIESYHGSFVLDRSKLLGGLKAVVSLPC